MYNIQANDVNRTRIALFAVRNVDEKEKGKLINTEDLTKKENKKLTKEFEIQILNNLGTWDHYVPTFFRWLGFN